MVEEWPGAGLAGLIGLVMGSYCVTAGIRLARNEASALGRSHCDACCAQLSLQQTIPLFSYVRAKGVCSSCGARIDPLHLAGEVAGAMVIGSVFFVAEPSRAMVLGVLGLLLITASSVDVKIRRLPDALNLGVGAACATLAAMSGASAIAEGIVAAAIAVGLLLALRWISQRRRNDPGLGLGDVKLIAALAIWLGPALSWALALASVLGLLLALPRGARNSRIAFGPFVAGAAWITGMSIELGIVRWPI